MKRTMLAIRRIVTGVLLLAAVALGSDQPVSGAAGSTGNPGPSVRPNIIYIMADDLGWTDLGCQGSRYYETPNIDRLAAEGLRFTQASTCGPNCQPTRAALMSGQYGPRTGVYTVGSIDRFDWRSRPLRPVDNVVQLPLDRRTFADQLKRAGYATAMFGKWHLGNRGGYHPSKRGFDEAIEASGKHFDFSTDPRTEIPAGAYLADWLTDRSVDFIRRHRDRLFLLYLPHFGVHSPHQAKEELRKKFAGKPGVGGHRDPTYAAMIASVDESVGRILKTLEELGLGERTLVIFTSDNGGVGGYAREGIKRGGGITDNAPLRSGKGSLYEGGVRVPFLARWPGVIPAGRVTDAPIITVDVFPTLLELTGAPRPDQPLDGVSLAECFRSGGKTSPEREAMYWHFPGYLGAGQGTFRTTPAGAIRVGNLKLLEFFEDGRLELYDLAADPSQQHNLAKERPAEVARLHEKLKAWRAEVKAPMPTKNTLGDAPAAQKKAGKAGKKRADPEEPGAGVSSR
jgi:arylsulfatase A-like enzyme